MNLEKIYKEELDFLLILNGFSGTVNASITTYTYINYDILQRCKEFVKRKFLIIVITDGINVNIHFGTYTVLFIPDKH